MKVISVLAMTPAELERVLNDIPVGFKIFAVLPITDVRFTIILEALPLIKKGK